MNTDIATMPEFVMEVQNAKNIHPMKPQPCENMAAWVLARYIDERLGAAWELVGGYHGQLMYRRGQVNPDDYALTWEKDYKRIGTFSR